jgi:hypothetical protein
MTISDCGATRIVTFTMRFYLVPIGSSASRMSTGVPHEFFTRSSGTWPSAGTSFTWIVPSAIASSRQVWQRRRERAMDLRGDRDLSQIGAT